MLPLLVETKIFGKRRRRQHSRSGSFQGIFGFISVLAVLSLGGFGCNRDRNILNRSSLWKRRMRNKGLVILQKSKSTSCKKNNDKIKEGE
jgi:hypothetical protein